MERNGGMFRIDEYMEALVDVLKDHFGERLLYVGLQGSYLRGEATEKSDIDAMAVLDALTVEDMDVYRDCIQRIGDYERSCGFICGLDELRCWNPLEFCHLLHSTKDWFGSLTELLPEFSRDDIRNGVKMNVCNLYHEICHRYIHSGNVRSAEALPAVYKSVFFILQDLHYLENGVFAPTKRALLPQLSGMDREVLETAMSMNDGGPWDFESAFSLLHSWCKDVMTRV